MIQCDRPSRKDCKYMALYASYSTVQYAVHAHQPRRNMTSTHRLPTPRRCRAQVSSFDPTSERALRRARVVDGGARSVVHGRRDERGCGLIVVRQPHQRSA